MTCERVNKDRACLPLLPITVHFQRPDPGGGRGRGPADGWRRAGVPGGADRPATAPVRRRRVVPRALSRGREASHRAAGAPGRRRGPTTRRNAAQFPLAVATDEYPPLVKFPASSGSSRRGRAACCRSRCATSRRASPAGGCPRRPFPAAAPRARRHRDHGLARAVKKGMERAGSGSKASPARRPEGADGSSRCSGGRRQRAHPGAGERRGKAFEGRRDPAQGPVLRVELASPRLRRGVAGRAKPRVRHHDRPGHRPRRAPEVGSRGVARLGDAACGRHSRRRRRRRHPAVGSGESSGAASPTATKSSCRAVRRA